MRDDKERGDVLRLSDFAALERGGLSTAELAGRVGEEKNIILGLFWSFSARLSRPLRILNERLESEVCNCKPCKDSARERGKESAGKSLRWSICGSNQSILSSLNSPGFAARLPEQHGAQRRKRRSSSSRGSCNGTTGEHREPSEHPGGKFSAFSFPLAFLKQSASFSCFVFVFFLSLFAVPKGKKTPRKNPPW